MNSAAPVSSLVDLGLTELESKIYLFLLQHSPATGYGVAKGIGKPTANAYKGVESLLSKGFIIAEEGNPRLFRAIPGNEMLNNLEQRFKKFKQQAESDLVKLKPSGFDERVYNMNSSEQVIEKLKQMLGRCENIALLDLFPSIIDELKKEIADAIERGVKVVLKVYEPVTIDNALIIVNPVGKEIIKRWPACWANTVVDGKEHLLALLSTDLQKVHQAVWSGNTYLSWIYHSALFQEFMLTSLSQNLADINLTDEYKYLVSLDSQEAPGYKTLINRLKNPKT